MRATDTKMKVTKVPRDDGNGFKNQKKAVPIDEFEEGATYLQGEEVIKLLGP